MSHLILQTPLRRIASASACRKTLPALNCTTRYWQQQQQQQRNCSSSTPLFTRAKTSTSTMTEQARKDVNTHLAADHATIFQNNRKWATEQASRDPDFFVKLSAGQEPEYLYIGCSDSRVAADQVMGLEAGQVFTHRNIANLVCNTDLNVMSVINYAVRHLKVKHIIVCGHYSCGGVKAAMTPADLGLLNPWLRNIRDVYRLHEKELDAIGDSAKRYDRLAELNVIEQARNVVKTAAVQQSYEANRFPIVHAWMFDFRDGLLKDLKLDFEKVLQDIQKIYNLTGSSE